MAAPQVGVNIRLMVFNEAGIRGEGKEMVLAKPRIIKSSSSTDTAEEMCLSFKLPRTMVAGDVSVRC